MERPEAKSYLMAINPKDGHPINIGVVQRLAYDVIPDGMGLRSIYWMLLLGYLPPEKDEWEETLAKNRKSYFDMKEYFKYDPHSENSGKEVEHVDDHVKITKLTL